jgi:hypothetical protein
VKSRRKGFGAVGERTLHLVLEEGSNQSSGRSFRRGNSSARATARRFRIVAFRTPLSMSDIAGIDNELYFSDRTSMLFGDAKAVIGELVKQLAGESGMH